MDLLDGHFTAQFPPVAAAAVDRRRSRRWRSYPEFRNAPTSPFYPPTQQYQERLFQFFILRAAARQSALVAAAASARSISKTLR